MVEPARDSMAERNSEEALGRQGRRGNARCRFNERAMRRE